MDSSSGFTQENALSFDVEHWHEAALLKQSTCNPTDYIEDSVSKVLRILDRHDVSATFFILGEVAKEHPELVSTIQSEGHELGSHGHVHESVSSFTPESFRENLERSAEAIKDASGVCPTGFRAPNFSITSETAWAFEVLAESEYRYDSSVFPMSTPLYGVSSGPRHPYEVRTDRPFDATPVITSAGAKDGELTEIPLAVAGRRVPIPIAGGFYGRVLPPAILEWGIRWFNQRGLPATLYFHPWEFNTDIITSAPRTDKRLISFYGIDSLASTLDRLLETFAFGTVKQVLADQGLTMGAGVDRRSESGVAPDGAPQDSIKPESVPADRKTNQVTGESHATE